VQSCGDYGSLMQSGLKVSFIRNCSDKSVDSSAQLVHVETLSGQVLLDLPSGISPKDNQVVDVATLDFLAEGGSGYTDFIGVSKKNDLGVLREVLADSLVKKPVEWTGTTDGRWLELKQLPEPAPSPSAIPSPFPSSAGPTIPQKTARNLLHNTIE
jgi:hypothetical protein